MRLGEAITPLYKIPSIPVGGRKAENTDMTTKDDVLLAPNPAKDYIEIQFGAEYHENVVSINLISTDGSILQNVQSSDRLIRISLTELPAGVYYIQIELPNQPKIIKRFVHVQ